MVRRTLPENLNLPLQLQLTHPRWVVALSWLAPLMASCAVLLTAYWQDLPIWLVLVALVLSAFAYRRVQRRQQCWLKEHYLCFDQHPGGLAITPNVFLGTFSTNDGQTGLIPVTLQQHWTHFFGLTLRLNLHNRPHNKAEVVTLTLWRSQLSAHIYRRLSIWVAWQAAGCTPLFKGETA